MNLKIFYNDLFECHEVPQGHPERKERIQSVNKLIKKNYPQLIKKIVPFGVDEYILKVHSISYLKMIKSISETTDILKLDNANVLDSYSKKYHIYDHEFGSEIKSEEQRKKRGIFYTIIIAFVFFTSHYMAANHSEEPAGFYPPYVEKKIVFPVLYKKNPGYGLDKK